MISRYSKQVIFTFLFSFDEALPVLTAHCCEVMTNCEKRECSTEYQKVSSHGLNCNLVYLIFNQIVHHLHHIFANF